MTRIFILLFLSIFSFNSHAVGCYTFGGNTYDCNVLIDYATGLPFSSTNPMPVSASVTPAVDYIASGNINVLNANLASGVATTGSTVATGTMNGVSTATIEVTGTFSETLLVQTTTDGSNWTTLPTITTISSGATAATITAAGNYQVPVPATAQVRVTCSAYTSGTAAISIRASTGSGGGGGGTAGSVTVTSSALPTGGSTSALQNTGNSYLALISNQVIGQGAATAGQNGLLLQAATTTSAPSYTSGTTNAMSTDKEGNLRINSVPSTAASSVVTNVDSTAYEASRVISNAPVNLLGCFGYNSKTSAQFMQLFNSTTVPADTTAPTVAPINVPASSSWSIDFGVYGRSFATGIAISNSSTGPTKTIGSADTWFSCRIKL